MGNAGCTDQRVRYVVCRYLYGTPECVAVKLMSSLERGRRHDDWLSGSAKLEGKLCAKSGFGASLRKFLELEKWHRSRCSRRSSRVRKAESGVVAGQHSSDEMNGSQ